MSGPVFVDTNVLIYALDQSEPVKLEAARRWRADLWKARLGRTSYQVLEEFYAKIVQKWPKAREQARAEVRDLLAWKPVPIDAGVIERAWQIQDRYRLPFWDALIVSAAKSTACRYLLTEDLQEGQNLDGVIVINPFRSDPASLASASS